ncbi:MAG: ATP synthase F0 subunit C [Oscillospiraceae bacterium]|jgi:F-type H+-transporting ATPase subunit c|nr:ATP synthase F0 subunit C [Oscillospiraceae bacterium]
MRRFKKLIAVALLTLLAATLLIGAAAPAYAAKDESAVEEEVAAQVAEIASETNGKALASALTIGIAALGGAIAMGFSISNAVKAIARQPEAESKIRTALMLGLVFIETLVIYALIVVILLVFVL